MLQQEYRAQSHRVPPRDTAPRVYSLASGEFLFKEGHFKRHIYRVETGAVCIYVLADRGQKAHLEFAYPGDWFGFGYLEKHICRARAIAPTIVTRLPLSAVEAVAKSEPRAEASRRAAIEREFTYVREATRRSPANPLQRVAAFLLSLSSISRNEGRDASFVTDTLRSGLVADCLTMSLSTLSSCLVELEQRGLIEPHLQGGLRIKDFAGLEAIADQGEFAGEEPRRSGEFLVVGYEEIL